MTAIEAAQLLELPVDASPEQIEARFLELRRKLEDKIAKAPTPGLQAKYRESFAEITTAFETLALAADSSALPLLNKSVAGGGDPGPKSKPPAPGSPPPATVARNGKKKSGAEFLIVAVIALAVLGAGGWFVMKTRAENAAQAQRAAEQKVAAEARAAAEKAEQERKAEEARVAAEQKRQADEAERARIAAEQERRDRALALQRSKLAQLNVQAEALFRDEPTRAARRLNELKTDERALSREKESTALARLRAQLDAQQGYVDELETILSRHPAKSTQAQATELVSARELDAAGEAIALFATQLEKLDELIRELKKEADNAIFGTLQVENAYADVRWTFTDAFGEKFSGSTPQTLSNLGVGTGTFESTRPGWPVARQSVVIRRAATVRIATDFRPALLTVGSTPAGMPFTLSNGQKGKTPAKIELPAGRVEIVFADVYHEGHTETVNLGIGEQRSLDVKLKPTPLWNQQEIAELVNGYTSGVAQYAYTSSMVALETPAETVSAVVVSALSLNVSAAAFPPPPNSALKQPGTPLKLDYFQLNKKGWINTGTTLSNGWAINVPITARPDCDGLVLLVGNLHPTYLAWLGPLQVYAATHPELVPLAQAWAASVRLNLKSPAPATGLTYRIVIAVKFRRTLE